MNRKMIARQWLIFLATCVACVPLMAFAAGSTDDDAKAVQGNWKPATAEFGGQPMADAVLQSISLKLDNGKYEVSVGAAPDSGTYTLDSATNPKSITIT